MGYPEGVKGYCFHDSSSGTFFIVHDVIFDEDLLGNVTDDDNEEGSSPAAKPPTVTASVPGTPTALIPILATAVPSLITPCRSMCTHNMTKAGQVFTEECAAAKAHLEELQDRRTHMLTQVALIGDLQGTPSSSEG